MPRPLWKGPFIQGYILYQIINTKNSSFKTYKIKSGKSVIFPSFVGFNFEIYNGYKFQKLLIKTNMVGKKFGEFIITKKTVKHK